MFRTITKILLIVSVALIVAGGLYLLAQTETGRALLGVNSQFGAGDALNRPQPGQALNDAPRAGHAERGGANWTAGILGMLRNLGIISMAMLGIAIVQSLASWATRRRRLQPAHAPIR